ncbi:hypothetical protein [Sphingomonas sp.]|uniref:hypothetical protein n=1 Tax=Sphingomonas sp. TaxID=28214 RepID=UPI00184A984A|nr:hypothetical protein [Sphingomonas sp.]MBA3510649.1 hypothetical protein [Sphingomonas sp.]
MIVRARQIAGWALLAAVAAFAVLMAAGPLHLIDPITRVYVGSIAALVVALSAVAFVAVHFVTRNRRRG